MMIRSIGFALALGLAATTLVADDVPEYESKIAPLLKKYCTSCHNGEDRDGGLSLESFAAMQEGGDNGPALLAGDGKSSRMIRLLTGQAKPKMPPKDQPAPTAAEIELLKSWIDGGAKGPKGVEPDRTHLLTPQIAPLKDVSKAVTAAAWSPDGSLIALGRFGEVELQTAADRKTVRKLAGLPGKVNALEFSSDGQRLVTASGIEGLHGEATLWNVADGAVVKKFTGHRDTLYSATLTRDGRTLATGSYDRQIILWDVASGSQVRTLKGHNDAIYDLDFSPDGAILASASGDATLKLWQVATGVRLDTLSQPLKEQYTVAFSPDGQFVAAGGVDNRIRVWKVISREKPQINPILFARFAHEAPLVNLAFTSDGRQLVSTGEDRLIKVWDTREYKQSQVFEPQPDVAPALAIAPSSRELLVGRMNGTTQTYPLPVADPADQIVAVPTPLPVETAAGPMTTVTEAEPNETLEQAGRITLPATVSGAIHAGDGRTVDADLFRFEAKAGQSWVLEVNAARSKSPLDSRLEVLDGEGHKVLRMNLQAVRDSYITFRGIDSTTRDCRVQNWEEMKLNEFLYLNGEVVKLYVAPRGPDSGFLFYPHDGSRRAFFDTSSTTHAMGEVCYIVQPLSPFEPPVANGLPVFPLYYDNDDDGLRKLGADSRLTFTAPADGAYFVRVSDVRGFQGENYKYQLVIRPSEPGFNVTLQGATPTINAGSGKEFSVVADRLDGFEGEIRVDVKNLPAGFSATTPLVIQAGHDIARGTLNALPNAQAPSADASKAIEITATGLIGGKEVTKPVNNFGEIKFAEKPKVLVTILPSGVAAPPPRPEGDPLAIPQPLEIEIAPGETITATVRIERNGHDGRVEFEALNHNLPHGVIVDNIGLNGLMIVEGQTERTFFLTAADWVPDTVRTFHLKSKEVDNQTSWPVLIRIRKPAAR